MQVNPELYKSCQARVAGMDAAQKAEEIIFWNMCLERQAPGSYQEATCQMMLDLIEA